MTAISEGTPMVRPSMVREARSLEARRASAARNTLSRKANMRLCHDLAPVLSGVHDQLGGRIGQHEVMHALTVDLDRARLDFARGVRDRLREAGLGEQLVDPNAGGGAYAFGQRHCLYVRRNFVTADYAVKLLLRACGVRGGVEIGYDQARQFRLGLHGMQFLAGDARAHLVDLR